MAEGVLQEVKQDKGKAVVAFGRGRGLEPQDLEGAWRCAQLVARSGLAPKGMEKPEAVLVAAAMGAELGLSFMQSLQNIAVINGRPAVWGDALLALVEGSGELAEFEERFEGTPYEDAYTAVCRVVRVRPNGFRRETEERFSVADAKKAGLWGKPGPWQQYPRRMLRMRARSFALRNVFPDKLKGVKAAEEVMDIPAEPVTPGPGTPFEVVEEPPPQEVQPEPELPVAPAAAPQGEPEPPRAAVQPDQGPPRSPKVPQGDAPQGPPPHQVKQVRRATHGPFRVPEDLLEHMGGVTEVRTAGIRADTLWAIRRAAHDHAEVANLVRLYLHSFDPPLSRPELEYLREVEGLELLERIQAVIQEKPEETPSEPEPAPETGPEAGNGNNGNGWVACNGPYAGKRVSTAAVCATCPERGDCTEFAQHRRQAAAELF